MVPEDARPSAVFESQVQGCYNSFSVLYPQGKGTTASAGITRAFACGADGQRVERLHRPHNSQSHPDSHRHFFFGSRNCRSLPAHLAYHAFPASGCRLLCTQLEKVLQLADFEQILRRIHQELPGTKGHPTESEGAVNCAPVDHHRVFGGFCRGCPLAQDPSGRDSRRRHPSCPFPAHADSIKQTRKPAS